MGQSNIHVVSDICLVNVKCLRVGLVVNIAVCTVHSFMTGDYLDTC